MTQGFTEQEWRKTLERLNAVQAERLIHNLCGEIQELTRRDLEFRIQLGQLLLAIQDRELYRKIRSGYRTWQDFLDQGFVELSGLHARTAYDAMELAKSKVLSQMGPTERAKISSVANARLLVRMERIAPETVTPEVVEQAKMLPLAQFRQAVGASSGMLIRLWVSDVEAGKELQKIVGLLGGATADALRVLRELLESDELSAFAGGPDNKIDCMVAACRHEIQYAEITDRAVENNPLPEGVYVE